MAWNQASVHLLASGWRPVVRPAPGTKTVAGGPVLILSSEREMSSDSAPQSYEAVCDWLEQRGFVRHQEGPRYVRWTWEDVEASVHEEAGELRGLYLRFTLSRESPARWPVWEEWVRNLCATWDLGLVDPDEEKVVGASQLFPLLSRSPSWQEFAGHFHWPSAVRAEA